MQKAEIKVWSTEELDALKEGLKTKTVKELAEQFNCTEGQVRHVLRKQCIAKPDPNARTEETVQKIAEYGRKHGLKAAAKKFGVSHDVAKNISRRYNRIEKDRVLQNSPENLQKIRTMALWHARKDYKLNGHVEDFASYVVLEAIQGKHVNRTTLKYLAVDYKRVTFGDVRNETGKSRAGTTSIDAMEEDVGFIPEAREEPIPTEKYNDLCDEIGIKPGIDRLIFMLHFVDGFGQNEIADRVGLSAPRVNQLITEMVQQVRQQGVKKEDILG